MKSGRSPAKGASFEREICKDLSYWWTDGERTDIFWRTAGSGARATTRARKGQQTAGSYGDLTFIDPIGKPLLDVFCFELKRGYKPDALDLIDKRDGKREPILVNFWHQATYSAEQANAQYPCVIFKRDQKMACIMLPHAFFRAIFPIVGQSIAQSLSFKIWDIPVEIVPFDHFLGVVTPESVRGIARP